MKINLDKFVLCGGGNESPEDLRINGTNVVQQAGFLRARLMQPLPRGNTSNQITFSVTREHASVAAAGGFLFAHAATVPASGTLTVYTELFEGQVTLYTATASAVSASQGSQRGITTTHQYTIFCGPITGGSIGQTPAAS